MAARISRPGGTGPRQFAQENPLYLRHTEIPFLFALNSLEKDMDIACGPVQFDGHTPGSEQQERTHTRKGEPEKYWQKTMLGKQTRNQQPAYHQCGGR